MLNQEEMVEDGVRVGGGGVDWTVGAGDGDVA